MRDNNLFSSETDNAANLIDSGAIVHHNVMPTPSTGFLLGDVFNALFSRAMTHSSVATTSKRILPMQNALGDFNYIKYFNATLRKKVYTLHWLNVKHESLQYDIIKPEKDIVNHANTNTTMFIGTTYALNSTFNRLEVSTYVKLDEQ